MFETSAVNKLILLFIFDQMEIPLQEKVLIDMTTENKWIGYMDCKDALCDLIKTSFVTNMAARGNTPRYAITSDGRECLNHFYINIPSTLRDTIAENIKENRLVYRKNQDYFSDYYKNADGTYTVVLKIDTATFPLMELKLNIQSRHTAKWIFKNWRDKAAVIYEFIHETLVE